MNRVDLSYEMLSALFEYTADGIVMRKVAVGNNPAGSVASVKLCKSKYAHERRFFVHMNSGTYRASRIIWILHNKKSIPEGMVIDHINGNRLDDRPENLRCVTRKVNAQNITKPRKGSKSQLLGVSSDKREGMWRARIFKAGKLICLGSFSDPQEAHEVYVKAKREFHEGCTI